MSHEPGSISGELITRSSVTLPSPWANTFVVKNEKIAKMKQHLAEEGFIARLHFIFLNPFRMVTLPEKSNLFELNDTKQLSNSAGKCQS